MKTLLFKPKTVVVLGTYGLQGAGFVVLYAMARAAGEWKLSFQSNDMRLLAGGAAAVAICSIALLVAGYRASAAYRKSGFKLPLTMSLVVGILALVTIEVAIRVVARPHALGWQVGQTVLRPHEWSVVARTNLDLVAEHRSADSYLIEDPDLGWTIGQSRSSADGLYHSSVEGLRSDERGREYGADALAGSIALLGDSFAFGDHVRFEDSLGAHIERSLSGLRVLNFGVAGYGVDQTTLRFERDVTEWAPSVAIFTFIEDDLYSVTNTYVFLKTDWGIPLSKPRFSVINGRLQLLNSPTLSPERMFATRSIFDLPSIEQDSEFFSPAWSTHPLHVSFLLRYLIARFPIWQSFGGDDEVVAVSTEVIRHFVATARAANVTPVVAYLATSGDLRGLERGVKKRVLAQLAAADIEVHDLTHCLRGAGSDDELFLPRGNDHYSGRANAAVGRCLATIVSGFMNSEVGLENR